MQGAREYAELFRNNQQHGKLYIRVGEHARGKTFHVYILPTNEPLSAASLARLDIPDSVEVYGITGGQPGWTETYGWLHRGKWEQDFEAIVEALKARKAEKEAELVAQKLANEVKMKGREQELLAAY